MVDLTTMKQMGLVSFRVKLNDGTVCQTRQDQICRQHDSVDTAPMPTMVEPPNLDTLSASCHCNISRDAEFKSQPTEA